MNSTGTTTGDPGGQGRRQRDQPARHRRERLIRRQHNRLILVRDGDGASRGVFADLELKEAGQIVEPDHRVALHVTVGSGRRPSRDSTVIAPP